MGIGTLFQNLFSGIIAILSLKLLGNLPHPKTQSSHLYQELYGGIMP
jgi:hypothetical protein